MHEVDCLGGLEPGRLERHEQCFDRSIRNVESVPRMVVNSVDHIADVHARFLMPDNTSVSAPDRFDIEPGDLESDVDLDRDRFDVELCACGCVDLETGSRDELLINVIRVFVGSQDSVSTIDTIRFTPDSWVNNECLSIRLEAYARV